MNAPKVTPKSTLAFRPAVQGDTLAALKAQNAELSNQIERATTDMLAVFRILKPGPDQTMKDITALVTTRMSQLLALQELSKGTK